MEKPHLVLLHAALGNSGQMAGVAAQLETRFCVHNFQFPGHDGVDPDAHICLNALVQSVEAYLMHQKLERPTVLGNSLGGYVAALLEARKPGSIGSLITFATKWFWDEATVRKEQSKLVPATILEKAPSFATQLQHMFGPNWEEVVRATGRLLDEVPRNPVPYGQVSVPVWVFRGDQDKWVTEAESIQAAQSFPKGKFQEISGAGHGIHSVSGEIWDRLARQIFGKPAAL
jgi:pimeloyl-ACP methyl ester carboxylesterase